MLSDNNIYEMITKDLTKKLTICVTCLMMDKKRVDKKGFTDDLTYRRLYTTERIPRAYNLTKIHKQNYPLRIIVYK